MFEIFLAYIALAHVIQNANIRRHVSITPWSLEKQRTQRARARCIITSHLLQHLMQRSP